MKRIIYSVLALVVLASCAKTDEVTSLATDDQVRISSSIATRTSGDTWVSGDEIGIYMSTNGADPYDLGDLGENVPYITTSANGLGNFTPSTSTTLYYPAESNVDMLAYYPYKDTDNFDVTKYPVKVADQTDQGAIDLLVATVVNQVKTTNAVDMAFDHKLSRIQVTLVAGDGLDDEYGEDDLASATVKLLGTYTEATFDLTKTTEQVTLLSETGEIEFAPTTTAYTYQAIVIPQALSGVTLQFATPDYGPFTANITASEFTVGNEFIYTATLNRTGAALSSPIINSWDSGNGEGDSLSASPNILYSYVEFKRNESNSENMTKVDDAGAIKNLLSKFRRCLMTSDAAGNATICYLQDDNSNYYADGSEAVLTGEEGDVMVYFPEYWYKYENVDDDYFRYHFSESKVDGYIHVEASLLGAYKAYVENEIVYSRSDVTPSTSVSQANFIKYSKDNRGSGYQIIDYEQHCTIAMMLYAKYLDRNTQAILGTGSANYATSTGLTNSLGNNDGASTWVNGLGIEGVYGGVYEGIEGVVASPSAWTITNPTYNTTRTVNPCTTGEWITALAMESGEYFDMVPTAASGGSNSTYYADARSEVNEYLSIDPVVYRSGSSDDVSGGVSCVNVYNLLDSLDDDVSAYSDTGSRLAFRGTITEAASVEAYKEKFTN